MARHPKKRYYSDKQKTKDNKPTTTLTKPLSKEEMLSLQEAVDSYKSESLTLSLQPDGILQVHLELQDASPPSKAFSANAVVLDHKQEERVVYIYFITLSPSGKKPKSAVCIRLFENDLRFQMTQNIDFLKRLSHRFSDLSSVDSDFSLEMLDDIPGNQYVMLDGSFLYMAYHLDKAIVDVYSLPPDFDHRLKTRSKHVPDVSSDLRIKLSALNLFSLLSMIFRTLELEVTS